jgi:hypothetical protein
MKVMQRNQAISYLVFSSALQVSVTRKPGEKASELTDKISRSWPACEPPLLYVVLGHLGWVLFPTALDCAQIASLFPLISE